jgi:hypothetical protein
MKIRTGREIIKVNPALQRIDNEASTALKRFLSSLEIYFQLVPPYLDHRNPAERAITCYPHL